VAHTRGRWRWQPLGLVSLFAAIVETLIALSIAYVAVEEHFHFRRTRRADRMGAHRHRCFAFGLLHGIGFASVLGEIGLFAGAFLHRLDLALTLASNSGKLAVIHGSRFLLLRRIRLGERRNLPEFCRIPDRWPPNCAQWAVVGANREDISNER